jgi:CRP/FNR family transcriptional regulator, nitrogen oxide reductase regulator
MADPATDRFGGNDAKLSAVLARAPLLSGVSNATLETVLAGAARRAFAAGSTLFRQGDPSAHLHLLVQGRVKVMQINGAGSPLVVRFMGPGDLVGCVAVFRKVPYPATATAVADTVALSWPAPRVAAFLERYPRLAANALTVVGTRTEELLHRLREMATERVETRIARTLLRLSGRTGLVAEPRVEIDFPISRQDIAEMAGTDLYTVSRVLSRWRRQGILETGRQRIAIRAMLVLGRLAGGDD